MSTGVLAKLPTPPAVKCPHFFSRVLLTYYHRLEERDLNSDDALSTHLFYLFDSRAFATQTNPSSWFASQHHSSGGK